MIGFEDLRKKPIGTATIKINGKPVASFDVYHGGFADQLQAGLDLYETTLEGEA